MHAPESAQRSNFFEAKTDLDRDLKMANLAIHDMTPRFDDFEPVDVTDGLSSRFDCDADRGIGAVGGGSNNFKKLVDVIE